MYNIEKHAKFIRTFAISTAIGAAVLSVVNGKGIAIDTADVQCAIHIMKMGLMQASTEYVDLDKATRRCVNRLAGPPEGFIPYKPNNRNP